MSDEYTFSYEMRIEASPEIVFSYFIDPRKMARWMGISHKLDAVPGGGFVVDVNPEATVIGEFVEVEPPTRLVFTWGWRDSTAVPPGSTTIEVNLTEDAGATLLNFTQRGLPDRDQLDQHAHGWSHFMTRLQVAGAGGDPGPDPMAQVQR